MMTRFVMSLLLGLGLSAGALAASQGQMYKWTDDKGIVHYSDSVPENVTNAQPIRASGRQPADAPAAQATREQQLNAQKKATKDKEAEKAGKPATASTEPAAKDKRYEERCEKLRENLNVLQSRGRVREADEKGETRYLTDEEKQQRLDDIQRQIKAFCEQ